MAWPPTFVLRLSLFNSKLPGESTAPYVVEFCWPLKEHVAEHIAEAKASLDMEINGP